MPNHSALDTLIKLSQTAFEQAGVQLAKCRNDAAQAQQFLDTLGKYRRDYALEMQVQMKGGMDAQSLVNYRSFLGSLDKAIEQAKEAVENQGILVEKNKENWDNQWKRLNSFETLHSRREKSEQLKQQRSEQRQTDELSAQVIRRRGHSLSSPGF